MIKIKKKTNAQLKKKLWKIFSQFIRLRDGGICFTCGAGSLVGSNYHAGHFIPKAVGGLVLYFHEDNVHGQCARCNLFMGGEQYVYGSKLGEKKVKELYALKGQIIKDYPFQEKIDYYNGKLQEIKKAQGA